MYPNYDAAQTALATALMDVAADFGEEAVDDAYSDVVHVIADDCPEEWRDEFLRRNL